MGSTPEMFSQMLLVNLKCVTYICNTFVNTVDIYIINRSGPRVDSCGTLFVIADVTEKLSAILVVQNLRVKQLRFTEVE